jgi:hypothetical protein
METRKRHDGRGDSRGWRGLGRAAALFTAFAGLVLVGAVNCGGVADSEGDEGFAEQSAAATAAYDWLQFYGDNRHMGNNTLETILGAQNVSGLTQLFQATLPAYSEGPPAILTGVSTSGGVRDLAFITTRLGDIFALDANTGATVWSHSNPGSNFTTSAAAVDPSRAFVYSYGLDGKVHKYAVGTGVETTTGGWPEVTTLKPSVEKGITSLAINTVGTTSYLYIGYSGYGDSGDYQGHVTAINLGTGAQKVFNSVCSDQTVHFVLRPSTPSCAFVQAAIWGRSAMVYSPATGKIYGATGNGTFDPATHQWGDTLLALNPDGSGVNGGPLDSYTPGVFATLQSQDLDLGSASIALLPGSGTTFPNIALQAGKDNVLRIVNLDNLSGAGGPGHVGGELFSMALPQSGTVANGMPVWVNPADSSTWVYVSTNNGLAAFKLVVNAAGSPSLSTMWQLSGAGGALIVANNVLYRAASGSVANTGTIQALNPTTGAQLWNSGSIGSIHWQSPVVANGVLYVADNSAHLTAFSLPSAPALSRTGWVATASSSASGNPPSNALDGVASTRWSTGAAQTNGQWFQVDMTGLRTFTKITLDTTGSPTDYPRGYQVLISNNGTSWSSPVATGAGTSAVVSITFPAQTARFVRIVQTGSATSWWSIHELNVYGTVATLTAYPRTGWTATASATNGTEVPARALDGNTSTRWSTGAPQTNGQWFLLDTTASRAFTQITLDAASSTTDYPRGYQVFVSSDGVNFGSAIATGAGTGALVTISFPSQTGRYIKIVQTGSATSWWSIAELNVWH